MNGDEESALVREDIIKYEELSMNAHPALKTQLYDGWVMRFSYGYTKRSNCVNPLYESRLSLKEKIGHCEKAYKKQGLPTIFKLTDATAAGLDDRLGEKGYEIASPTFMYITKSLSHYKNSSEVEFNNFIDPDWRDNYFRMNGLFEAGKIATATAILNDIQNDVICAVLKMDNQIVASGLCVVERGYAGLFDIIVDPSKRNIGCGYQLCSALLKKAHESGAKEAYLQVVASNIPAISLYKKLGFEYSYQYWYRVKKLKKTGKSNVLPDMID